MPAIRLLALSIFPAVLAPSVPAGDDRPIGPDFSAWRQAGEWMVTGGAVVDPGDEKRLLPLPGTGAILNGKGVTRDLMTVKEYGDVEAHIEFTVPRGSNSGVYFMGRYEVQVLDSWDAAAGKPKENPSYSDCGGIYERWDDARGPGKEGYEGRPPRVNAARRPGEWQTFDVLFRAPRFDGSGRKTENARCLRFFHYCVLVHEDVEVTGPTRAAAFPRVEDEKPLGPLMLQGDHGPVAYRRIAIRPAGPGASPADRSSPRKGEERYPGFPREKFDESGFVSIFDGKSLAGWHVSAKTGHSGASGNVAGGRWVVEDGAIVGSQDIPGNGGIVITDAKYGDFEVACEMRNDYGPDSGFFLRSTEEGAAYQYLVDYHAAGNLAGLYGEGMRRGFTIRNFNFLDSPEKIVEVACPTFPLPVKPADWSRFWKHGEWNELRARIEGNPPRIVTWLNGVRFMEWQDTEVRHAGTGGIAFQVHGGGDFTKQFVRYRKVRIKELKK